MRIALLLGGGTATMAGTLVGYVAVAEWFERRTSRHDSRVTSVLVGSGGVPPSEPSPVAVESSGFDDGRGFEGDGPAEIDRYALDSGIDLRRGSAAS